MEKPLWKTGDNVGLFLDLEERTLTYFVNGSLAKENAFINLPDGKYFFYCSCAEADCVEIVEEKLYLSDFPLKRN